MLLVSTMKVFLLLIAVSVNLSTINAGYRSNCKLEGINDNAWYWGYELKSHIKDDHEGLIQTFPAEEIVGIQAIKSTYLDAKLQNNVLSLSTNERFKKFEEEYEYSFYNTISIEITFECTDGKTETLDIEVGVDDVNNHYPVLNAEVYEFNFGTTLPADYDLTKFLSISAQDIDFTNSRIDFSIGYNEDLRIKYNGDSDYDDDTTYSTTLKTLKEIKAPFREEYTLFATDSGTPSLNRTARLVVNVVSHDSGNNDVHPPVFSKHLYFATYTLDNNLIMEEPITITYGMEINTAIKQAGYEDYFTFSLDTLDPTRNGKLEVKVSRPLPSYIVEKEQLIVIEMEAENKGLHIPGRTALIISLPVLAARNSDVNIEINSNKNCSVAMLLNQNDDSVPLITYLCVILFIVVINAAVLAWYFQKRNLMVQVANLRAEAVNQAKFNKI